jgi:hypothetical protein
MGQCELFKKCLKRLLDDNNRYLNNRGIQPLLILKGVLDLGGASTQIAFKEREAEITGATLGNLSNFLFLRSFLNFGIDRAIDRVFASLPPGNVTSPCLNTGATVPRPNSNGSFFVIGAGNGSACLGVAQGLLFNGSVALDGRAPPRPPVVMPFVGISVYAFVGEQLKNTLNSSLTLTWRDMEGLAVRYCAVPFSNLTLNAFTDVYWSPPPPPSAIP